MEIISTTRPKNLRHPKALINHHPRKHPHECPPMLNVHIRRNAEAPRRDRSLPLPRYKLRIRDGIECAGGLTNTTGLLLSRDRSKISQELRRNFATEQARL
nr:hypothetical protein CFP56_20302 [Quercus suber]